MSIINKIKIFFLEIQYPAKFSRALTLEGYENYTGALDILNGFTKITTLEYLSLDDYLEYYLFKSRLYYRLEDIDKALKAITIVDKYFMDNKENTNNKLLYLRKYLYLLLSNIYYTVGDGMLSEKYTELYNKIKLDKKIYDGKEFELYRTYIFPLR